MDTKTFMNRLYLLAIFGSVILIVYYVFTYLDFTSNPIEDAAMLMRYSVHLAQGYGIVWNIGEKPVDGGTDFLFLVVLASLVKVGLTVQFAARLVDIISHLLTVLLIYYAIIRMYKGSRWFALISAVYLAVGPALTYITAYFGTPFFALFACITWYLANKLLEEDSSNLRPLLFTLSALILGLIRPEGVLLAIFMLLAVLYMRGIKKSHKILGVFILTFLLLGGTYFLWRWSYFGYPLPNPFYKKGGGHIYFSSLLISIKNVIGLCGPFSLAFIIGFRSAKTGRKTIFLLIPTLGFTIIWVFLSNEMNYVGRFQYAILPMILMTWPSFVEGINVFVRTENLDQGLLKLPVLKAPDRRTLLTLLLIAGCICLAILWYPHSIDSQETDLRDGRYALGVVLSTYSQKNYTMATSEAGLLPLYSNWRDIDTWGLNDQWIAHHGLITDSYLNSYKPEIIMFHAPFSPIVPVKDYGTIEEWYANWYPMVIMLKNYAEKHNYQLASAYGVSPYDTYYYYVRRDFPDSKAIIYDIQKIDYTLDYTSERCVDFAQMSSLPTDFKH